MDSVDSTSARSSSKTSIDVTALDSIVNVNSLFTIAIFIGFSLTTPNADSVGNKPLCNAGEETVRKLLVSEIFSFSSFLCSSLIAQSLKLTINSVSSLDPHEHLKADINSSALKFGLLGSALGSFAGCVSLIVSISLFIQVKLGILSCGGESLAAVVILVVLVGFGLVIYVTSSLFAFVSLFL